MTFIKYLLKYLRWLYNQPWTRKPNLYSQQPSEPTIFYSAGAGSQANALPLATSTAQELLTWVALVVEWGLRIQYLGSPRSCVRFEALFRNDSVNEFHDFKCCFSCSQLILKWSCLDMFYNSPASSNVSFSTGGPVCPWLWCRVRCLGDSSQADVTAWGWFLIPGHLELLAHVLVDNSVARNNPFPHLPPDWTRIPRPVHVAA